MSGAAIHIRPLARDEIGPLVTLCAEHAAYERAAYDPSGKASALEHSFFAPDPRAHCLVAASNTLIGYATWSREFSTWRAAEYLHMDCLFVRSGHRGERIGQRLLAALGDICAREGLSHLEWQTPTWNEGAIRFYQREGATGIEKIRFAYTPTP